MKKIVALAALLLLIAASYADAGCAVIRRAVVVQSHAYVAPYVAPFHDLGYRGYYSANYDAQQALIKDQAAFIKLQTEAYQQLRQGLTQPRAGGNAEGAAPAAYASYEEFARARCISCHQDGTKQAEENGFVMFEKDGKISPFSIPERRRQEDLIRRNVMPPGGNLGQAEKQLAAQLLSKK